MLNSTLTTKNAFTLFGQQKLVRGFLLVALLFLFTVNKSSATVYTWGSTTTGGPWVTSTNWTGSVLPVSSSANQVTFNPSTSITINNTAPASSFTLGTFLAGSSNTGTTILGFSSTITYTITSL